MEINLKQQGRVTYIQQFIQLHAFGFFGLLIVTFGGDGVVFSVYISEKKGNLRPIVSRFKRL